jgi:hypothetical protein
MHLLKWSTNLMVHPSQPVLSSGFPFGVIPLEIDICTILGSSQQRKCKMVDGLGLHVSGLWKSSG